MVNRDMAIISPVVLSNNHQTISNHRKDVTANDIKCCSAEPLVNQTACYHLPSGEDNLEKGDANGPS